MTTTMNTETVIEPSEQQSAIIDWCVSGSGNLLIQAYAGCGKSQTLLMMLPFLSGTVLMAAFNKSAQQHLEKKVRDLGLENVEVKTIHAAGLAAFKYGGGSRTAQIESNKVRLLIEELSAKDAVYSQYEQFLFKLVGYAKRAGIGILVDDDTDDAWMELIDYYSVDDELPSGSDKTSDEHEKLLTRLIGYARSVYQLSLDRCKEEIDFDDMLAACLYYKCRFRQYDWILVDEVQDISAIHREILIRMLKPGGRMIGVGDFRQCIYVFCGTTHDAMDILKERMNMQTLPLSVTYRCPQRVVEIANQWVPDLEAHESTGVGIVRSVQLDPKPCLVCGGSGRSVSDSKVDGICQTCQGSGKSGPGFWDEAHTLGPDSAIICRNNRPIVELAYQLLRKGIPCQIEGRDFGASLVKLCQRWKTRELDVLEDKLSVYRDTEAAKWRLKRNEERAASVEDKIDTLITLLDAVRASGKSKVADLISRIQTMFGDSDATVKPKTLVLSSVHRFKGQQRERIYILGRNRYMPSRWARQPHDIRSEENVEYVAVTRAQKELIDIIVPEESRRRKV